MQAEPSPLAKTRSLLLLNDPGFPGCSTITNLCRVFHKKDYIYPDDNINVGDNTTNLKYMEYEELREYDRLPQLPADS